MVLLKHKTREIQIIIKEGFIIALTRSPRLKSDIKCSQLAFTLWVVVSDVTHPASVFTLHLAAHFPLEFLEILQVQMLILNI